MTESINIQPDSPFKIGTSGKFKLLIKSVTERFGDFEYLLIDAEEKEYKAIAKALYAEGQILRCMVSFKVERAKLVVESVAVCSKQDFASPIPVEKKIVNEEKQDSQKVKKTPKTKAKNTPKAKAESTRPTQASIKHLNTIEEVKRLIEAKENGSTVEELKYDILRLRQIIVSNKLQSKIINECGRENLLWILYKAKKYSNSRDSLNRTLRDSWVKWFKENYETLRNSHLKEPPYNEKIQRTAGFVDFVEIMESSESENSFFLNGLKKCESVAKTKHFYSAPKQRNENKTYVMKASPLDTRKAWGSPYRPARG
ncbi:MAG: hypothetical protein K5920_12090 [Bacteroidales bacterium]|nr:hypothetical protein [Bacteroidales bacterium]